MNKEKHLKSLLSALEERLKNGQISRSNYEHLKNKFENKLNQINSVSKSSTSSLSTEESIFNEALNKIVTKVYSCDYCGGVLDVISGVNKVKCSFCGYINEVDYLKRISERLRSERVDIIKGAMDSFAKVTNFDQLKIPLHEKFLATAHIYESRALRLEDELGKTYEYSEDTFEKEKHQILKIEDNRQFYEASKSWHQVSELYRNAAEFAPTSWENKNDLAASYYYDGLAFLSVAFAPIRLMNNTYYVNLSRGTDGSYWPWPEEKWEKHCETVKDLIFAKDGFYDIFSRDDFSTLKGELIKTSHPILVRSDAIFSSLNSALKAIDCFLKSYKISSDILHLIYALLSKVLSYILYIESIREYSYVDNQILFKIQKICFEEFYAPQSHRKKDLTHERDERSLKHANILRSIAKKFALFLISHFEDYIDGLLEFRRQMGFTRPHTWDKKLFSIENILGIHERVKQRLIQESEDSEQIIKLDLIEFVDKIDQFFFEKTFSFTLMSKPFFGSGRNKKNNFGFKFSWVLGKYKSGFLTYYDPSIYLTIESAGNHRSAIPATTFFDKFFYIFRFLASSPSVLLDVVGKNNMMDDLFVNIEGKKDWNIQLDIRQFLDLYYCLSTSFVRIKNNKATEIQNQYDYRFKYVNLWKKKKDQLLKLGLPKFSDGNDLPVLSPEFISHDLDFLSFFAHQLPTFPS